MILTSWQPRYCWKYATSQSAFQDFRNIRSDNYSLQWIITFLVSLTSSFFFISHKPNSFFSHYCAYAPSICGNHCNVPKATLFGQNFNFEFSSFFDVFFFSRLFYFSKGREIDCHTLLKCIKARRLKTDYWDFVWTERLTTKHSKDD